MADAMLRTCPTCGRGKLHEVAITERYSFDYGPKEAPITQTAIAVGVPVLRCDNCDEELSGVQAAYKRRECLLHALGVRNVKLLES